MHELDEGVVHRRNLTGQARPGPVVKAYSGLIGAEELFGTGWLFITLPGPLWLGPGHYWLSVQAHMDFARAGQWAWETRSVQRGKPAVWMNPGDGFETGCAVYTPQQDCFQSGQGPDYVFSILGGRKARP